MNTFTAFSVPLAALLLATAATVPAQEPAAPLASPSATGTPAAEAAASPTPAPGVEGSVVKVFSTLRYPDPYRPWSKQAPHDVTGSGAVIDGQRILTNAHVVLYASQIQIQANQSGDKVSATVEAVAPGIDLAVLKLDDASFFDAHPALPMAKTLPEIKDAVFVYGYPQGGTSLSTTKGIVSRIEFTPYNPPTSGLRIQIDAAINPGNSGGPAVAGDKMIGLAFSRLQGGAENIGYIIPTEEIELFLADIADGHYDGKPAITGQFQTLENPALRAFLKLEKGAQGMVVTQPDEPVPNVAPAADPDQDKAQADQTRKQQADPDPAEALRPWDLITRIGDSPIDDQGMVKIGGNLRVHFPYLAQKIAHDGSVPLTVVRAGQTRTITLPAPSRKPTLIPDLEGGYPAYFVCGPLVFEEASAQFIGGLGGSGGSSRNFMAPLIMGGSPLVTRLGDQPNFPGERLVVISSPFLPHKLSQGYGSPFAEVVEKVNGKRIKNLADLVETLRDAKDEYLVFEFQGKLGETLVFPRAETVAATEDILTDNGVRSQGSPDMLAIWHKK